MQLSSLLQEFGAKTGLADLTTDASGACSLLFDDAHEMTFTPDLDDNSLLFHAPVGSANYTDANALIELLTASLLGAETGGAALAIDRNGDDVILWKRYNAEFADAGAFEKAINDFLTQVVAWKERLDSPSFGATATGDAVPESDSTPGDTIPFGLRV